MIKQVFDSENDNELNNEIDDLFNEENENSEFFEGNDFDDSMDEELTTENEEIDCSGENINSEDVITVESEVIDEEDILPSGNNISLTEEGTSNNNDSGEEDDDGTYVTIIGRYRDLDTAAYLLEIEGRTLEGGVTSFLAKTRDVLSNKVFNLLLDKGIDVPLALDKESKEAFLEELKYHAKHNVERTTYTHDFLGYHQDENNQRRYFCYLSDYYGDDNERYIYTGRYDIEPKGEYKLWKEMYENHIKGHANLEMGVAVGLTAPLVYRINQRLNVGNLLVALVGESTVGKTTLLQLMLGMYANPTTSGGIMENFNGTDNAIAASIQKKQGFLNGFDEATSTLVSGRQSSTSWQSRIYDFASGEEKRRMSSNLTIRDRQQCFTTTVFTTEISVIASLEGAMEGQKVRLLEVNGQFTDSAEQSNAIKQGSINNCGHVIYRYIRIVERISDDELMDMYNNCRRLLSDKIITDSKYKSRIIESLAVIYLSAFIVNNCEYKGKKIGFEIDEPMLLINLEKLAKNVIPVELTADGIIEEILHELIHAGMKNHGYVGDVGSLKSLPQGGTECFIVRKLFHEWLNKISAGRKSVNKMLDILVAGGYLQVPGDPTHRTFVRSIGALDVRGYVIIISGESKFVKTFKRKGTKKNVDLLADDDSDNTSVKEKKAVVPVVKTKIKKLEKKKAINSNDD